MFTGFCCGVTSVGFGVALVVATSIIGFVVVPNIVEDTILSQVVLLDDSIQLERFKEVPFPLNFTVRFFNISNSEAVLNGAVPIMTELGPYVYKLYSTRVLEDLRDDVVSYRKRDYFEFDPVASYPRTQDDIVTIANVIYHGVLQIAESQYPDLMGLLNRAMPEVFGNNTSPIMSVRVEDLLFSGVRLCENPGVLGSVACLIIRRLSRNIQNMDPQSDGTILFSFLGYRNARTTGAIQAYRGIADPLDLGRIFSFNEGPRLTYWEDSETLACNTLRGTDSGIYRPFVDKRQSLHALSTDICRSVELRYQHDTTYDGIPAVRYAANEWFLANEEGCYCLNVTRGINAQNGCLLPGAMELYSCIGAYMVLSYPHFLYADAQYRNGVLGMNPSEDLHRIFLDIEPHTGTVLRGGRRAQFNVFMRPVTGANDTSVLRTTLTPLLWVDEGVQLPQELSAEISTRLVATLDLLAILLPAALAVSCLVLAGGLAALTYLRLRKPTPNKDPTVK